MAWLYDDKPVQEIGNDVFLYNLSRIRGVDSVISRIPERWSGVYVWYRSFMPDAALAEDSESFFTFILEEIYKKHCSVREASLPPSYGIMLKPQTSFPKEDLLKQLSSDKPFRELVLGLLDNSIIFQQPLYIGKSENLSNRIKNHLKETSTLRLRLQEAGHEIDLCKLLLIKTGENHLPLSSNESGDSDSELPDIESEQLIEDILSRLFLPSFTLRYG